MMNLLLMQNGYLPITIKEDERAEYFESIENNTFCEFAAKKEVEALNMFLEKDKDYER